MIVVPNRFGELIPAEKYTLVSHLIQMKQKGDLWKVVEEVIKVFQKAQPKRWDSYIIQLQETKDSAPWETVGGKRFRGVKKDRSGTNTHGMTNVHQVDFPIWIMLCLRKLYNENELSFSGNRGKRFFREFGRRFPLFRIIESV